MLVGVVQRSGTSVGGSRSCVSMRVCSAWKSGSNFGSPLSSAWSTAIELTPSERAAQRVEGAVGAHRRPRSSQTPFTIPSPSQPGSPSVQRIFFGLLGGSFTGASKTSRQSVFELPPPPKIERVRGARRGDRATPSDDRERPGSPSHGAGVLAQAPAPRVNEIPVHSERSREAPAHPPIGVGGARRLARREGAGTTGADWRPRRSARRPGMRLAPPAVRGGRGMSLRYALLALLAEGEAHGYQLVKRFTARLGPFWHPEHRAGLPAAARARATPADRPTRRAARDARAAPLPPHRARRARAARLARRAARAWPAPHPRRDLRPLPGRRASRRGRRPGPGRPPGGGVSPLPGPGPRAGAAATTRPMTRRLAHEAALAHAEAQPALARALPGDAARRQSSCAS